MKRAACPPDFLFPLLRTALFLSFFIPVNLPAEAVFYGELNDLKGRVEMSNGASGEYKPASGGMPVQSGDRVKTFNDSSCNLELDDGSLIFVGENTEMSADLLSISADKHSSKFSLFLGRVIANIAKTKNTKMEIHSPTAVAAVRGTEFAVEATAEKTDVGVFSGQIGVKNADENAPVEVLVNPDEETAVARNMAPEKPGYLSEVMKKHRERNIALRERSKLLKERLRRINPEKRDLERRRALERFKKLKVKTGNSRENMKNRGMNPRKKADRARGRRN